jgi:hypothetical protein
MYIGLTISVMLAQFLNACASINVVSDNVIVVAPVFAKAMPCILFVVDGIVIDVMFVVFDNDPCPIDTTENVFPAVNDEGVVYAPVNDVGVNTCTISAVFSDNI